jgi:hypothetical protein
LGLSGCVSRSVAFRFRLKIENLLSPGGVE